MDIALLVLAFMAIPFIVIAINMCLFVIEDAAKPSHPPPSCHIDPSFHNCYVKKEDGSGWIDGVCVTKPKKQKS